MSYTVKVRSKENIEKIKCEENENLLKVLLKKSVLK